ncbi:MAG: hypothetical protein V4754_09000 [Pseudomonadota bacterium]
MKKNIETVLEIKFAGDSLDRYQRLAYERIAGVKRFRLLEISDCDCGKKRPAPATAPVRVPVTTPMQRESQELRRWYQLPPPKPSPAPAPQPQLPQYGPMAEVGEHRTLATFLKENPGTSGVILVGAILLAFPPTRNAIVGAVALGRAGAALLVTAKAATAAPTPTKETK